MTLTVCLILLENILAYCNSHTDSKPPSSFVSSFYYSSSVFNSSISFSLLSFLFLFLTLFSELSLSLSPTHIHTHTGTQTKVLSPSVFLALFSFCVTCWLGNKNQLCRHVSWNHQFWVTSFVTRRTEREYSEQKRDFEFPTLRESGNFIRFSDSVSNSDTSRSNLHSIFRLSCVFFFFLCFFFVNVFFSI